MSMDVAAFNASVVVSPHTKKKITAKKLLGRGFILEEDQRRSSRSDKAEHLKRKRDLDRQAREISKVKTNG